MTTRESKPMPAKRKTLPANKNTMTAIAKRPVNRKVAPLKKADPAPNPANLSLERFVRESDSHGFAVSARVHGMPEMRAASVIQKYEGDNVDINYMLAELEEQVSEVNSGSMRRPEAMLVAQMHTLDGLFANLARRAHGNMMEGYGEATERYLKLALRAQSQCRATIETLSLIKTPPVIFAKQANVTTGPQQINNGASAARALETENQSNKLLETYHANFLDTRTTGEAISRGSSVETVGEEHRAEDAGR